jgi:hypothetical protein
VDKIPASIDGISAFAPLAKRAALRRDLAAALSASAKRYGETST